MANNMRPYSKKDLILTPEELRDVYLFGVDLTDDNGQPYPDRLFDFYIQSAHQWLEAELPGLTLARTDIPDEVHDYHINDYQSYSFMRLFRFPVQELVKVELRLPLSSNGITFDPSWFRLESTAGQVNLLPVQGTFSNLVMSQGGNYLPLLYTGQGYVPGLWKISYTAGFKRNEIPHVLKNLVGLKAAQGPLNIAGDLIAGAGIASKSVGLDGLSQSISTTASATNAGYGSRIIQYNKEIEETLKNLRHYYGGINMAVI